MHLFAAWAAVFFSPTRTGDTYMKAQQFFAEIRDDGVLVFDDFGRDIAFVSKEETMADFPLYPEEAWEMLLERIRALYCIV